MNAKNNRSFFRINAMIPCGYRVLSAEEAKKRKDSSSLDAGYIEEYFLENFHDLDEQIKGIVVQIGQKSDLLAKALTALNSKINFVMQTVDVKQLVQTIPLRMVNLSAGGIQFKIDEAIDESNKIEVLLQLSAEDQPIMILCNIVKTSAEKDGSNLVSLKYISISEEDRRKLIYFIQSKEIELANQLDE